MLGRFLDACRKGDVGALTELLAEDAVLHADGGAETRAARVPVEGAARVARFLVNVAAKTPAGVRVSVENVNGRPGILVRDGGAAVAAIVVETGGDRIDRVYAIAAPSKLARV
ncbi:MAG TPA: nuclear transport factor 2 family protein [Actinomycetota bacterium]|nr:nuclear transport factor 2 family protein [Actinomycetota bacterium]